MPVQKQSRLPLFALGGVGLLALAGGVAYWALGNRNPQGAIPVGINLVPQSALYTVSVTTDGRDWQELERMGNPEAQKLVADTKTEWQQKFLTERGLDYARDIQPWVGQQVTLAHLPITPVTVAANRQEPKIWILPIDENKLAQALQNIDRFGGTLERRTYKNIEIRQTPANAANPYGLVIIDQKWLVLASVPSSLELVIDTFQGQPSLLQEARYTQALAQIATPEQPFAQFYLNVAATNAANNAPAPDTTSSPTLSPSGSPSPSGSSPNPLLGRAPDLQGFAANLDVKAGQRQLYFRSVSWLKTELTAAAVPENRPQNFADLLPASTRIMYTGSNFRQFWLSYDQGSKPNDTNPFAPSQLREQLRSAANLDMDKDLVTWMNGPFGAAILPADKPTNTPNATPGWGLVLMADTSDRGLAEKTFKQLDAVVQQKQWLVTPVQVSNQNLTAWVVPPNFVGAHHGWLNNNTVFLTMGSPVVTGFVPRPNDTLSRSQLFQNTMRSDLQPNSGQFFMDVRESLVLIDNNAMVPKLSPDLRKYIQVIHGLGVTSAAKNNWSTRYDILVELLPKQ
jgi:hypothetical protein